MIDQESELRRIAEKIRRSEQLTVPERKIASDAIDDAARIKAAQRSGRPRRFASDKERYDFHNARKRELKKRQG